MKTNQPQTKAKSFLSRIPPPVARVLTAVVLVPILIASILFDQLAIVFCVGLVGVAVIASELEIWLLARKKQAQPDRTAQVLGSIALLAICYFTVPGKLPDMLMVQLPPWSAARPTIGCCRQSASQC